jgi:hypothetical protein
MVPIVFAETRKLAQEWTLRFFGAALDHARNETAGAQHEQQLRAAPSVSAGPSAAQVRAWAIDAGFPVADRGRIRPEVWTAYHRAHATT